MEMCEFGVANRKRCEHPKGFNHKLSDWSLSDWLVAVTGELGEAANILKKLNRLRDGIPGNSERETVEQLRLELADEIADVYIYLDLFAQAAEIDLERAILNKFRKTSHKIGYPG